MADEGPRPRSGPYVPGKTVTTSRRFREAWKGPSWRPSSRILTTRSSARISTASSPAGTTLPSASSAMPPRRSSAGISPSWPPPAMRTRCRCILERIRRGKRVEPYETLRRRKDGTLVEISLSVSPIRDRRGRIVGASKIAHNIIERRRMEQERELRLGELRHRVKNLLGMVGAIAGQTKVKGCSAKNTATISWGGSGRLMAAHEAAFQEQAGTDLATLIDRLLEPYAHLLRRGDNDRGRASGEPASRESPASRLCPARTCDQCRQARSAVEGLRADCGSPGTSKRRAERRYVQLDWQELGGPPVEPTQIVWFRHEAHQVCFGWRAWRRGGDHLCPSGIGSQDHCTARLKGGQRLMVSLTATCGVELVRLGALHSPRGGART